MNMKKILIIRDKNDRDNNKCLIPQVLNYYNFRQNKTKASDYSLVAFIVQNELPKFLHFRKWNKHSAHAQNKC